MRISTDIQVRRACEGKHHVARGLYLRVTGGSRLWQFRYQNNGRRHEMGIGTYPEMTLAQAREAALALRRVLRDGRDPLAERRAAKLKDTTTPSFTECAKRYISAHAPGWRSAKGAAQWESTLATYAFPKFGDLPVRDVGIAHVIAALEPIWATKSETANRLRGRIEAVLDWARARGFRDGDNPARWRGHLDALLPARSKVRRVEHFAALPYGDVATFMAELAEQEGVGALALRFLILTAARTSEVIGARWTEMSDDIWTIPGERMKAGRPHRVPLPPEAMAILEILRPLGGAFVFPGGRKASPLSSAAMTAVLKRMGRETITVHGFRSSFRDWARERTNFPREVAEAALAHTIKDKAEAAYARGDVLDKRRALMAAWARFCTSPAPAGDVVSLRGAIG